MINLAGLSQIDIAVYGAVAFLLPPLLAVINRPSFPSYAKLLISGGVSAVAGFVSYYLKNGLDLHNHAAIVSAVLGVAVATQVAYKIFWNNGTVSLIDKIEAKVNGGKVTAAPSVEEAPDSFSIVQEDNPYYDVPIPEGAEHGPAETDPGKPPVAE